jgi:AraC family transcriptional regulator of adaptative response / DNA-3-methyladenine glycosylase II
MSENGRKISKRSGYDACMKQDRSSLYKAFAARDARFDGLFFVGVTSTGIYCRPICPSKTPKISNCRFYETPQQAEQHQFRPCLRCRPELAPGSAPVDDASRIAHMIVQRIEKNNGNEKDSIEAIADQFELSARQIRRIIKKELGVSPMQLILTRRLLLAKQLLTETKLPVTDIAFASGFSSLRRFNDAFSTRYGMTPSRLRKSANENNQNMIDGETSTLQLSYRPPYDWTGMLAFLRGRQLKGIEWVTEDFYARTVKIGLHKGWIKITQVKNKNALLLEFSHTLTPVLPTLLARIRDLLDLNARPDIINKHLARDKVLAPLVKANPGQRVPGVFLGFEMGLRAILGQQISVKAATTIACRIVEAFCEPIVTPYRELKYLSPSPQKFSKLTVDDLAKHGITSARCKSIIALAQAESTGELSLESVAHQNPEEVIQRLCTLPGIGPWTAHYMAMRALRWPDAFPPGDVGILNNLGGVKAKEADQLSQAWRPWRAYAVLHIWHKPA